MRAMVPVPDGTLWTEDSGGDGPPLVLLHPGIGDLRVWEPVWPALTEDFRCVRYDFRGYGGSPLPTAPFHWVDDLFAVLDHLGIAAAHIVGNSQGGSTALAATVAHPDRVRSLTLLGSAVSGYPWPQGPESDEIDARYEAAIAANDEDALVALMLDVWCAAGHEELVRDLVLSGVRAGPAEQFQADLGPTFDHLGELTIPVTLLIGDRDYAPLNAVNQVMAERIPGARLVTAAGVDHLPSLRVPDLVVQLIRETAAAQ